LAVAFVIVLKVSLLISIFPPFRPGIIALMPLAGRCSFVVMMTALPYVRREGGLATVFGVGKSWLNVLWTSAFLLAAGWLAGRLMGLAASFSALLMAALFSVYCFRKIGGYTGDTLGAGGEIAEIIPAIAALALMGVVY
ncbi:MAG: adenosylcobinamide-GDP ribazoletransferase, partial [Syntrophales bacterium]